MKTFYVNVRYLIVPVMTVLTIYGLFLGGIYAWTGVFLFGLNIILDTATKNIHLRADFDENGNSFGIKTFQYIVMYLMLPIFIVLQCALAWNLYQFTTSSTVAVEHWSNSFNRIVGSTKKKMFFCIQSHHGSLASHFTYAHVYQHHLELHQDAKLAHMVVSFRSICHDTKTNISNLALFFFNNMADITAIKNPTNEPRR